jgi:putative peptide zinc metalloprotease protein
MIVLSHLWFYLALGHRNVAQLNELSNFGVPLLLLLFSFGGMLHEFGHAAALTRFGGKTAEIGFGIYICFAALFVDLSEAWRLTGKQRVVVDLSGMYFQGILLTFLAAGYVLTGWAVLACCFIFIDLEIVANLNPLLRLDGYWALADGLGIPNLRTRSMRYFLLPMLRRGREAAALKLSPRMLRIMQAYFALTAIFSVFMIYAISAQTFGVVQGYPRLLGEALDSWRAALWLHAASLTIAVFWRGMLLLGLAIAIFRAIVWISQNVRSNSSPVVNAKELPA